MSKWAIAMTIFPTKWWANGRDGSVLGWQPDFGWFLSYYLENQLLLISINWKTPKTSLPKGLKTHGTFLPLFQVVGVPTTNKKTNGSLPKRQLLLDTLTCPTPSNSHKVGHHSRMQTFGSSTQWSNPQQFAFVSRMNLRIHTRVVDMKVGFLRHNLFSPRKRTCPLKRGISKEM